MSSGINPQTPKKTYKATAGAVLCCCRLCRSTGEVHFKNIFAKGNRALLSTAEEIYGRSLEKDDLPHLLCRPCERRLKSFQEFKLKITVTQDSFLSRSMGREEERPWERGCKDYSTHHSEAAVITPSIVLTIINCLSSGMIIFT